MKYYEVLEKINIEERTVEYAEIARICHEVDLGLAIIGGRKIMVDDF